MTVVPRRFALERALGRVSDAMSLRRPQQESLEKLHQIMLRQHGDLGELSTEALGRSFKESFPQWSFSAGFPQMTFALATGVGKTRLMAALMAYLYLANQSKCFLLLAPRTAILRKTIEQSEPTSDQYLFVDSGLIRSIRVWHSGNIDAFTSTDAGDDSLQLFIFSPQSLTGDDRLIKRVDEFSGTSVEEYLKSRQDLVALIDESHHLDVKADEEARAWSRALRTTEPKMAFGMTATPRQGEEVNVLHEYPLRQALLEKLYTKDVRLIVRERTKGDGISEEDWDHLILDFALDRLKRKEAAIANYTGPEPLPYIQPVVLVAAENTAHADATARWLIEERGLSESEVLVTHSRKSKTEDEIQKLLAIEKPSDTPVRVVVNVFELTEGWDVTNVYVVAPLRAMSTYQGAIQTMGRGLRLPAGHRLEDAELDSLDVLCFGRQSLNDIVSSATEEFGSTTEHEVGVGIVSADDGDLHDEVPTKQIEIAPGAEGRIELPRVRRIPNEPDLTFDIVTVKELAKQTAAELELSTLSVVGSDEGLKYEFDLAVRLASGRVIAMLRYLSEPLNGKAVEGVVARFLEALGCTREAPLTIDWMTVAAVVADQIDRRYRRQAAAFRVTEEIGVLEFGGHAWNVPESFAGPVDLARIGDWNRGLRRLPIKGWKRCTSSAPAFDSGSELEAARIIDRTSEVEWWVRNDPPVLRIATPIGRYGPDFVTRFKGDSLWLLEIKQSELFEAQESDARVKARAAAEWCAAVTSAGTNGEWRYSIVLDDDVDRAATVEDLMALAVDP